jgi:transposase
LGLAGLAVERVALTPLGVRVAQLVTADPDAARCPDCGQLSISGKEWTLTRPRDLPVGGTAVLLQWRKRRWRCGTVDCPRQSFTNLLDTRQEVAVCSRDLLGGGWGCSSFTCRLRG